MIKTENILITVNAMNYKHYLECGYSVLTSDGKMARNKIIIVNINDAKFSYGSGPNVEAECDYCKKNFNVKIGTIKKQISDNSTCFCKNCRDSIAAKKRVKNINPGGKKILQSFETIELCSGGCGKKATHYSKSGKNWCNEYGGLVCINSQNKARETFKKRGHNIGIKNGSFGKTESIEMRIYKSNLMKLKIANGEFTPNITNSWANSKTFLQIDNCKYFFRSSWEAIFWLKNKKLEYEKIRIGYMFNDIKKNYIVDFVDYENKILYEIKPKSEKNREQNILKKDAAIKWAKYNGYRYLIITEDWFKDNLTESDIIDFSLINEKIRKGIRGLLK